MLSSFLILLVDLGTELMPAISLAWEDASEDLMIYPPRKVLTTQSMVHKANDHEKVT